MMAGATVVLSDLDGVLVDSRDAVTRAWLRFADRHDLDPETVLAATFAGPSVEVVGLLTSGADVAAEAALVERWQVEDTDGVRALPGAGALLGGWPLDRLAVVTSCSRALALARLAAAGLPAPPTMVTAEMVRVGKPDPEGYRLAASLLGAPPVACVVLEDAPAGARAGRAAGMRVIGVATTHAAGELAPLVDLVVPTLAELPDLAPAPGALPPS
jgi:sugar-phosphatase